MHENSPHADPQSVLISHHLAMQVNCDDPHIIMCENILGVNSLQK